VVAMMVVMVVVRSLALSDDDRVVASAAETHLDLQFALADGTE
jgi:hypothetical protein